MADVNFVVEGFEGFLACVLVGNPVSEREVWYNVAVVCESPLVREEGCGGVVYELCKGEVSDAWLSKVVGEDGIGSEGGGGGRGG